MNWRRILLAAALGCGPGAASAQTVNGLYIGGGVGVNLMPEQSVESLPGTTAKGRLSTEAGAAGVVSLGWGFGNGFRAELEGSYRYNGINGVSAIGPNARAVGNEQKFGIMTNLLYDVPDLVPVIQPYVGVGLGYQWAFEQGLAASATTGAFRLRQRATEGNFAYQGIVGAAWPVQAVPGLAVTGEYRFMGLAGNRSYDAATISAAGTAIGTARFSDNYNHSLLVGLRYSFGAPDAVPQAAPPPLPAPASLPARTYLVFFDWDKSDLTDRARQIIAEAATNVPRVQTTRIEVSGHTDASGSPRYNQALSERRAQAVAAELVRRGVAREAITIQGFGKSRLLVPTKDGVREPQNRRVEIVLR